VSAVAPHFSGGGPRRKLNRREVTLFALLGLVALGALMYRPLQLRHKIHKVQSARSLDGFKSEADYLEAVEACVSAARSGSRPAMDAVIDSSAFGNAALGDGLHDVAYRVVASQPRAFFEVLGNRPDAKVIQVLGDIAGACLSEEHGELHGPVEPPIGNVARELRKLVHSRSPGARKVAQASLSFVCRRFGRIFALEDKPEGAKP
jgi:hypothetical protein